MSVICLTHEDNNMTGLDYYETDMHRQMELRKFSQNVSTYGSYHQGTSLSKLVSMT